MLLLITTWITPGLSLAAAAESESPTKQLARFARLASVLLSGFILNVRPLLPRALPTSERLPMTPDVQLPRDPMPRGSSARLWRLGANAGIGLALVPTWPVLRHRLSAIGG